MPNQNLTEKVDSILLKIAHRLSENEDEAQDCLQEGRLIVIMMDAGQKDSYYLEYGKRRMQNFLKKERLFKSRNLPLTDEEETEEGVQ